MAEQVQQPLDATTYGDKQVQEQQAKGLDVARAVGAQNESQIQPPAQPEPQQPQQPFAPRNLMQVVPPSLLFQNTGGARAKPEADQAYDIGTLWKVLASAPDAPPSIRAIAQRLMGEK